MAFIPTEAQKRAITARDSSILLSAAAGSGKTATLTRRIIESLTDGDSPLDLSRMLIVTFTRAAAAELRERISTAVTDALSENPENEHLNRQAMLVGSAEICTIDAFCLDVVRADFQRLTYDDGSPLTPDLRLADDTELKVLRLNVMNSVIDSWYKKSDDGYDFSRFVDCFSGTRDEGSLIETLISYADALESLPNSADFTEASAEYIKSSAEHDFFASSFGKIIYGYASAKLKYCADICRSAVSAFSEDEKTRRNYMPAFAADLSFCEKALNALDLSYTEARDAILSYSPVSLSSLGKSKSEISEGYKELRGLIKNDIEKLQISCFALAPDAISKLMNETSDIVSTLSAVINDYRREYSKEKRNARIAEFSDIKRLAHRLLVNSDGTPTDTANELRKRFDAVYIDEYQDVDRVQDEIFSAVSRKGCRFVVGDIKQSIYSFRGAEPSIFGRLRDSLPKFETPEALSRHECSMFMSENFRCDRSIIDFVNRVSRYSFVPAGGTVGYRKEDDLICGKRNAGCEPVTVALFNKKDYKECNAEAIYIVNEIRKLIKSGKKNDGTAITPSDIAVLCRSNSTVGEISAALEAAGIERSDETASDFFANPEIQLVLSLVTVIDNPEKDIPLASVLLSPFFGFTLDELVQIRKSADSSYSLYGAVEALGAEINDSLSEKCASFVLRLEALRQTGRSVKVDKLVRKLYREFSVMSLISSTDGKDNRPPERIEENLHRFSDYARHYSATAFGGISGFIGFVTGIIEGKTKLSTPSAASPNGAVTLMSIHKSKGLEFPVVFVCGCAKGFNKTDLSRTLIFDPDIGVALKLIDATGFARTDTPMRSALALHIGQKQTEEEMRILYVALTRASERLYITASLSSDPYVKLKGAAFRSDFSCRESVLSVGSYIDWILPALAKDDESFRLITKLEESNESEKEKTDSTLEKECDKTELEELKTVLCKRFSFKYPYALAEKIPAKLSVSRLYPEVLDDSGAARLGETDKLPELTRKPLFIEEVQKKHTGAERGTATHLFLQFCDFERAEAHGIQNELFRLINERFIPKGTAELVNLRQLERFFSSRLYSELKKAKKIYREQRFNLLLPASEFTADKKTKEALRKESITVQGVIDLFFEDENGKIVLCDYKTDYLTQEELSDTEKASEKLIERHGMQLGYYAAAVEKLLGKAPNKICIYSLPLGKEIIVSCTK